MLKAFYPDEISESSYSVDYEKLYSEGIRGIIFDIDNTLVCHGAPADERSIELFKKLASIGFKTIVLSNNKEPRVKSFADAVNTKYIYKADKPSKRAYTRAMEVLGTDVSNTIFIGDQIFTDIAGAKRCKIRNILVKPIGPKEEIQIVIKRKFEKIVLNSYKKDKR